MATTKVKIFIASSAEVKEERDKCILYLNQVNKSRNHLHLEPIEWEYDIAHGSYPDFESVQKAINPLLAESDICIFIFHSKIGKYTKEEFELANKLGIKLYPYFKVGFSPKNKEEINKYSELISFKESMNDTILYESYESLPNFGELLKDNLHLYLSRKFPVPTSNEHEPLSNEVKNLMKILSEKQDEIEQLKNKKKSLPDKATKNMLESLEQEKKELLEELNKNEEIRQQQAKEKQELELRLAPQIARDNLKEKALIAIKENNYDDAEKLLKESAEDTISETASTFYELGKLKKIQLLYKEALRYFELAVKIKPEDFDMNIETGSMLRDLGYNDGAIQHFEKALKGFKQSDESDNIHIAYLNNELGLAYKNKGEYDKAINFLEKSLAAYKVCYEEEHTSFAACYNNIGLVCSDQGDYDKAISYYEKALAIDKKFHEEENSSIAIKYNNLGSAYNSKGEHDKAISYYEKSLVIDKKLHGEEHPDIAIRYGNIGLAYANKGEHDKAISYCEKALLMGKKFHGEHPKIAIAYNNIGLAYTNKGEYKKAINYYEKALVIDKKFYGKEHPEIATRYFNIGSVYRNQGDFVKAIKFYEKSLAIDKKFLPDNHQYLVGVKKNIENCLKQINK